MSLLENLPKEVKTREFESFLEKIKDDFPAEEFPEIFVYYQQLDDKILVLGLGDISECASQAFQFLKGNPELTDKAIDALLKKLEAHSKDDKLRESLMSLLEEGEQE